MILDKPTAFREAIALLQEKRLLPASLGSADLAKIEAEILRLATFSAKVTDAEFLQQVADLTARIVEPRKLGGEPGTYMDKATMRLQLKQLIERMGYAPDEGKEGSLQDLQSDQRLDLIVRTNVDLARGFGQHVQANDAGVLEAFPCQELFRLQARDKQRDWPSRWRENGGSFFGGGRMIARKDDEIWTAISRFSNPYPPFDYNSGMWVKPVPRAEAVRLGVIEQDVKVEASPVAIAGVQASAANFSEGLRQALVKAFGGKAQIVDGVLTMKENAA